MKICSISDLHSYLPDTSSWQQADLFICGGDSLPDFRIPEQENLAKQEVFFLDKFIPWLNSIPATEKILHAGNHDGLFEARENDVRAVCKTNGITYLRNESYFTKDGTHVWASPVSFGPEGYPGRWAFGLTEEYIKNLLETIPEDVEILSIHTPPYGVLDNGFDGRGNMQHFGSKALREFVDKRPFKLTNLKLMLWGHLHEGGGNKLQWTYGGSRQERKYFLGANVAGTPDYHPEQKPFYFEI